MRSVILSNSVLIVTAPSYLLNETSEDDVVIRDQVNEILELTPTVPKLQKLGSLLKDLEYDEGQEDDSEDLDGGGDMSVSH
jgi:sister chromatid cohesion protein DCC1